MRIAQVAPLFESVPPHLYGGTERVVHLLTEELVRRGHEVTLFASGDSQTSARHISVCEQSLRLASTPTHGMAMHLLELDQVCRLSDDFDIIHFHTDLLHLPSVRALDLPHVTTMHGRLDIPGLNQLFSEFNDVPLISVSHAQQKPLPQAHWAGIVHHGLPLDLYAFNAKPMDYLAFLGRISPEKRLDRAIAIAKAVNMKLRIAAKVDEVDKSYFNAAIDPLLNDPIIDYIGEINDEQKGEFLGNARALLFPIDWPEPFGLVMIEAMACGTPVIAWRRGSVPEVISDPSLGIIVETLNEAIAAVPRAIALDRKLCRACFEKRYSVQNMANGYLEIYESILKSRTTSQKTSHVRRSNLHLGQLSPG